MSQDELKSGRRHSEADMSLGRKVKAMANEMAGHMDTLGFTDEPAPLEWAPSADEKALVFKGGEVKALGDGRVGGYLVRFSTPADPDLTGDFFDATTDFGDHTDTDILFEHGLDPVMKNRKLGKGALRKDEVGIWVEGHLSIRDAYEKAVYRMAEEGKLGWSSSTAPNLVQRDRAGKAYHIKSWPLGLDASLTTHPAEPRNAAMTLKAYVDSLQPAEQPAPNGAETPATTPVSAPSVQPTEIKTMPDEVKTDPELKATLEALLAGMTSIKSDVDAMKAAPVEKTPGVAAGKTEEMIAAGEAPAHNKLPKETLADEQLNAMKAYLNSELGDDTRKAWREHSAKVAAREGEQVRAFKNFIHNPDSREAQMAYKDAMKATLIEGTASLGGNLVPSLYGNQIVGALKEESIVRRAGAYQFSVAGTNSFNVPTITRSASAPLVTEKTISAQAEPTFGNQAFVPYAYRSLYIASREVVTDTRIPLENILVENAQWQLTQSENNHLAVGTGSGQPQGIAAAASTLGLSPGSTLALAFPDGRAGGDLIADIYHGLPYQYRDNAVWFANDATIKVIRKLRDGSGAAASIGNFLWQPGLQAGQPDRLMGRPIYPLNNMATSGSTGTVLAFGDPRFFWIADFANGGLDFQVLNELYAASMSVGYTFWKRFDSHLLVSEAVVGVKLLS
jgi:HK97 family phage major capsid protein